MKTKETTFSQLMYVWAIPHSAYHIEQNPNADPFQFKVCTDETIWDTGAVKVFEEEVTITVPAGIDLTQKAIDTLEAAAENVRIAMNQQIYNINQQISNLRLLTYQPSDVVVEEANSFDDDIPF